MNNNLNKWALCFWLSIALVVVCVFVAFFSPVAALVVGGLSGVLFFVSRSKIRKYTKEHPEILAPQSQPSYADSYSEDPEPTNYIEDLPDEAYDDAGEEYVLAYRYKRVGIACADMPEYETAASLVTKGTEVELVQEPDNIYDSRAVAVMDGSDCIGYLYRGKFQDMANDFLEAGKPIVAIVENSPARSLTLGFYKKANYGRAEK